MSQIARWMVFAMLLWGLSACGTSEGTAGNPPANQGAQQDFLKERGDTSTTGGETTDMNQNPPTIGIVQQVTDTSISLVEPMTQQAKTIQVAPNASIRMQGQIALSELTIGESVTVFGTPNGDQFQASMVQIGSSGIMGGPMTVGQPHEQQSDTNMVGQPGAAPGPGVSIAGTVEQVQANQFVVKSSDGKSVTVLLDASASIRKERTIALSEVEAGKLIVATGTTKDGTFEATDIEVLPAPGAP